ncbi:SMC-Scp complex subunit ScpB [Colwellia sp. MEBiC06753]
MNESAQVTALIEAIIFAETKPVPLKVIKQLVNQQFSGKYTSQKLLTILDTLINDYANKGMQLVNVAGGYRFQTNELYKSVIAQMHIDKVTKISPAMMETIAIIAYKQPITRSEIEEIRGVAVSSYIIKTLSERQWIKIAGHKEVPGRPALFVTTKQFLAYFGLKSLSQLPQVIPTSHSSESRSDTMIETET